MAGSTGALRKRYGMGLVNLGLYLGVFQAYADLIMHDDLAEWLCEDITHGLHPDLYSHSAPTG